MKQMFSLVLAVGVAAACHAAAGQSAPVVLLSATRTGSGPFVYSYSLTNQSDKTIVGFQLSEDPATGVCQLEHPPSGWTSETGLAPETVTVPAGWFGSAFGDED